MAADPYWKASPACRVCGKPSSPGSYLCERCRPVIGRFNIRGGRARPIDKPARLRTMQAQYDEDIDAFRCYFTGIALDLAAGSRRSAEWAHLVPGDDSSEVLACKLANRMQADLTEDEFRAFVVVLARHFEGRPFDETAFPGER